jgi:hypothetical protein
MVYSADQMRSFMIAPPPTIYVVMLSSLARNYTVNKLGITAPRDLADAWMNDVRKDLKMCDRVKPASSAGLVILVHWLQYRVVAVNGYSIIFQIVVCRTSHSPICLKFLIYHTHFCESPLSNSDALPRLVL